MRPSPRLIGVALAATLLTPACTTPTEEDEMNPTTATAAARDPYCGGLDAALVDEILPEVEVSQRGVPLSPRLGERDPRGNCTLDGPDGRPLLEVIVDATDTTFADQLRSRDSWQTETVEGQDGAGWAGRLGPADDAGGYAVLERSDAIASVTLHEAREGRDVAADALEIARASLEVVEPAER